MEKKTIYLTKEGKAELDNELKSRIKEREAIKVKIVTARAFGDLSENEDYSAARGEQKLNESRIAELEDILKIAKVIPSRKHVKAELGAKVQVSINGRKFDYIILDSIEANPAEGKISGVSPIGKAILGKKVGEEYTLPNGNKGKIVSIE